MDSRHVTIPRCKYPYFNVEKKMCKSQDEYFNLRTFRKENEFQQCHFPLLKKELKPWFTVIPLNDIHVEVENIHVKLNPLRRSLIIKVKCTKLETRFTNSRRRNCDKRGIYKPMKFLINLPMNIRMDKLQVTLTRQEELVICAPFKYPQQYQTWLPLDKETLNSQFLRDYEIGNEISFIDLPIIDYSTIPTTKRRDTNGLALMKNELTRTQCEDTDTTTTSEEESSESEWTSSDDETRRCDVFARGRCLPRRFDETEYLVKEYVELLMKIFYPNVLEFVIAPVDTRRVKKDGMKYQLVFNVKLDDLVNESIKVYVDIVDGRKVLIVEGKEFHKCSPFGLRSSKDVHRVVPLPHIFDVDKIVFHVLSNGVLNVKLAMVPIEKTEWIGLFNGLRTMEKKNAEKFNKFEYFNW